jgi:hypothetical protein
MSVKAKFRKLALMVTVFWEVIPCSLVNITSVLEEAVGCIRAEKRGLYSVT